jgi:hypothetical protein
MIFLKKARNCHTVNIATAATMDIQGNCACRYKGDMPYLEYQTNSSQQCCSRDTSVRAVMISGASMSGCPVVGFARAVVTMTADIKVPSHTIAVGGLL